MRDVSLSNYLYAKFMLDFSFQYNVIERLKLKKYLSLLRINEDRQEELDGVLKLYAFFNDNATSFVLDKIIDVMEDNKKVAIAMMEKESKRLQKVIKSYDKEKIEVLAIHEMKNILKEYMLNDEVFEILNMLYKDNINDIEGVKILIFPIYK